MPLLFSLPSFNSFIRNLYMLLTICQYWQSFFFFILILVFFFPFDDCYNNKWAIVYRYSLLLFSFNCQHWHAFLFLFLFLAFFHELLLRREKNCAKLHEYAELYMNSNWLCSWALNFFFSCLLLHLLMFIQF